jgi:hypothetical protein
VLDETERDRLAKQHRMFIVRRLGPVDAEQVDDASADALDLSVRLHHPALAPPGVQAAMREVGVPFDLLPMRTPPESMSARFVVRLADPRNERMLEREAVRACWSAAGAGAEQAGLALELRVPVAVRSMYGAWLGVVKRANAELLRAFVEVELASHARVKKDGESR